MKYDDMTDISDKKLLENGICPQCGGDITTKKEAEQYEMCYSCYDEGQNMLNEQYGGPSGYGG